jgi:hypothetical protein
LEEEDVALVLPEIVAELEKQAAQGDGLVKQYGIKEEDLTDEGRIQRALFDVWFHFVVDKNNSGKTLAKLLKTAKPSVCRDFIVSALGYLGNYDPEAEEPLAAIMRDDKDHLQLSSAEILIQNHGEKYGPALVDRVADKKRDLDTRHRYLMAFCGPGFGALPEKDQKRLIRVGFALLAENRNYFTATYLGDFVGAKFCPNQDDPKYHDDGNPNLNEAYFQDTVKKALAWWAVHEKEYAEKTEPKGMRP